MTKTLVRPDNNSTCPTVHADPQTYEKSYFYCNTIGVADDTQILRHFGILFLLSQGP